MTAFFRWFIILLLIGGAVFWWITRPETVDASEFADLTGDSTRGETVFWAGGCASCHSADKAEGDARLVLSGGQAFASDFGTFYAPNISSDAAHGIGGWGVTDLANAMRYGVSPQGQHYYPAFPYTAYRHVTAQDVTDLHAFLQTLPADTTASKPHNVSFPFNIRRSLGGWKYLFANKGFVMPPASDPAVERGRYLTEALGHCGECHTPRNPLGGLKRDQWLQGAASADGKGRVPGISSDKLDWSAADISYYLETGFTPDFDSAGGHMVSVIDNMSKLSAEDRAAIAAYLKAL